MTLGWRDLWPEVIIIIIIIIIIKLHLYGALQTVQRLTK